MIHWNNDEPSQNNLEMEAMMLSPEHPVKEKTDFKAR
jgi:hypothetical protein